MSKLGSNFVVLLNTETDRRIKVALSLSKKIFICFNDRHSKMMKNASYFILKDLFVLKIFNFLF